jgi:opacity protein-like surface antigen
VSFVPKALGSSLLVAALAMGGASPVLAAEASHRVHYTRRHAANTITSTTTGSGGTALTGDTLSSASATAPAAVPGPGPAAELSLMWHGVSVGAGAKTAIGSM